MTMRLAHQSRIRDVVLLLGLFLCLTACGGSYETKKIKDYRLTVINAPEFVPVFKDLIDDFNDFAGFRVLTYVETPEEANSPITIIKGLEDQPGNKVGLGQWLTRTESESPLTVMPGQRPKRVVRFSMRLDFDMDYFIRYSGNDAASVYERQKLFFHEVGHGMELDHSPRQRDLMYESVSGPKDDFERFFEYVRNYASDT